MNISKKLFLSFLLLSLITLILVTSIGIYQLITIQNEISEVNENQAAQLIEANYDVMSDFNADMVNVIAETHAENISKSLLSVVYHVYLIWADLFDLYEEGIVDETLPIPPPEHFQTVPGVSFYDIEEELRIISASLEMLFNTTINDFNEGAYYFVSESGIVLFGEPTDMSVDTDLRKRDWYEDAVNSGGGYSWTSLYEDAVTGELTVTCSVPVIGDDGTLFGVIACDIFVRPLVFNLMHVDRISDVVIYTFVIDNSGNEIIGSVPDKTLADHVEDFEVRNALVESMLSSLQHSELHDEMRVFNDAGVMAGYAPIHLTGWQLGVLMDYDMIIGPSLHIYTSLQTSTELFRQHLNNRIFTAILISAAVALLILAATYIISHRIRRSITKPLGLLSKGAEQIGGGNFEYSVEIKSGDELETLSEAFGQMTRKLREYIDNLSQVTSEKERISTELSIATNIQSSMLPCVFPAFPDYAEFDIYASMKTAREVGGDFYDYFLVDEHTLAVVIADVSGKGVPAALFMVIAKTLIKNNAQSASISSSGTGTLWHRGKSPKEVFESVNNLLLEGNDMRMFVTAFMGFLDIPSGRFTYVNAGHNPPLLRSGADSAVSRFERLTVKPGFILAGRKNMLYTQHEITLQPGDELFLYTDGITEAVDNEDGLFGEQRLIDTVNRCLDLPLIELDASVKSCIDEFSQGAEQADDITMLTLRYKGTAAGVGNKTDDNKTGEMIKLEIKAKLENTDTVVEFVSEAIDDCPNKTRYQVEIATEEIFTNIARHAYGSETGDATVSVVVSDYASITFEDTGMEYNPLLREDPDTTLSPRERGQGGLGLYMVKKTMDTIEYLRDGDKNILTIRKRLR